jgi:hypothetical protein
MNKIDRSAKRNVRINNTITRKVIELHDCGYVFDFQLSDHQRILCLQENGYISIENVLVKLVDMGYDQLSDSFKYIHTIETCCGKKGLLLADRIAGLGLSLIDQIRLLN